MSMFSPRFKSVAAMAGWDEEALLLGSLVVEDTPDRNLKDKKRSDSSLKSPPSSRRRKRRVRSGSVSMPVLNLDEDDGSINANPKDEEKDKDNIPTKVEEKTKEKEEITKTCSSSSTLACMDRLREELSCAICLEICYEPSTTPCGHSFCKNCLKSAADKCGKRCPKCRQLISNGRSCTINTVLWNTIQLLFPQEIESRKAAWTSRLTYQHKKSPERMISSRNQQNNTSNALMTRRLSVARRSEDDDFRSSRTVLDQDEEDALMALRLQREEFLENNQGNSNNALTTRQLRVSRRSATTTTTGRSEDASFTSARRVLDQEGNEGNSSNGVMNRRLRVSRRSEDASFRSVSGVANQDEDAAMALRLQREEFMEIYRGSRLARDNLRAMARRAMNLARNRGV